MLLQPIVEALGGTRVTISGRLRGDALELVVRSRPAVFESLDERLLDLRRRLEMTCGGEHRLAVHRSGEEVVVTLRLPALPDAAEKAVA
jgi:hypothetical protein